MHKKLYNNSSKKTGNKRKLKYNCTDNHLLLQIKYVELEDGFFGMFYISHLESKLLPIAKVLHAQALQFPSTKRIFKAESTIRRHFSG